MFKKLIPFAVLLVFSAGCNKNNGNTDLSNIIAIITMPTSTEESTDSSNATKAYESMPPGIPIVVDVDKSPVKKDPLDKGPFVNITKAIAHIGLPLSPDSLWGVWEFDTATGNWKKDTNQVGAAPQVIFKWIEGDTPLELHASDFILDGMNNIMHVAFHLFTGDSDELAWLVVDSMEYQNNMPVYTKFEYNILSLVDVTVLSRAANGHNLREQHLLGSVDGIVRTFGGDTIYTRTDNHSDLSQMVSVSFYSGDVQYGKDLEITAPDSISGYSFRDISGLVYTYLESAGMDTIGILEGKIWHPQDIRHKDYLDLILSETGERIHLWH